MKSIKLSRYFQIVKPEYIYLRVKPHNSIRNYSSERIAAAVHHLYKNIVQRIRREEKTFFYEAPSKVAYYIYIEKSRVEFYFIIPKLYLGLFQEKINDVWPGVTITRVDSVPIINGLMYQITYAKEDALSVAVDRRTNTLLSSCLGVLEIMQDGDKVGILYNFIPTTQRSWIPEYEHTMQKTKARQPVERDKGSIKYIAKMAVILFIDLVHLIIEALGEAMGESIAEEAAPTALELAINQMHQKALSPATQRKKEAIVLDTQILVASESPDRHRQKNNAVAVCEAFRTINEDNELIYKPYRSTRPIKIENLRITNLDTIKTSIQECQNFIALPGRELLEQYKCIEKVDTIESEVPEELRKGIICIGINTCKGKQTKAYLTTDKELSNLTVVVIGPTRAGKTTLFQNITKNALDNGECVIIPDFISWCKFSYEICQIVPKSKQLIIDCEDYKTLPGFGYNELWRPEADPIMKYDSAKNQTAQLLTLVDCINASDKTLSAKMDRYLESAALVVFSQYGSMKDVFEVLRDHRLRHKCIENIPSELEIYLQEYIYSLLELDETDRQGNVIGTRLNAVAGILDRVARLKRNTAMEVMLKKGCEKNLNLLHEIQKPQLIIIRMPDSRFATEPEKDFMCTYWLSKLWLTLQLRDTLIKDRSKRIKVNIIWDELYQIPYTQGLLRDKLSQIAKFDARNFISCHYLSQISIIRDELKAANSSYMLLQGCDLDNYRELKKELYPYTEDDLLNLKRYNSLNLLKYEKGWAKFITQLPKPIRGYYHEEDHTGADN